MAELNPPQDPGHADSLVARLRLRARAHPQAHAYLQKRHGVWHAWDWRAVDERVEQIADGLRAAGIAPGQSVGVVSGARIEAVLTVHACQRAGLTPVLLSPNLFPGGLATLCQQAGVVALVVEDQEQVDKVADIQSRLDGLQGLWVIDPKGVGAYRHIHADPLAALGTGAPAQDRAVAPPPASPPAAAVALFSAGVLGEPRLVTVSHATVLAQGRCAHGLALHAQERCVSLFGLADPLGHYMAVVAPVLFGSVPCFGEDRLPSVAEMRQCAPRLVAIPARLLDRLRRETTARAHRAAGWQQALIGQWEGSTRPHRLLRALVGAPVARGLGLANCRQVVTGYERMAPASARFLARLGIPTRGLYGLSEAAGPVAVFEQAQESTLVVFAPFEARVDAQGELCLRIDGQEVQSGDRVSLHGGQLQLVGRASDLLVMPGGERVAPTLIEAELLESPYVSQAVAVGGPASGVTLLVELDEVTLRDWAQAHALNFTTLRSFAQSSEVRELIAVAVAEANQRLPRHAQVRRTVLLPRALEMANGELTPSMALRRAVVRNRYAHRLVGQGENA